MKKCKGFILGGLILLISFSGWAQEAGRDLYLVTADTGAVVDRVRLEMESRFEVYNGLFRFDPSLLSVPLNVRVFDDREAYRRYVFEQLGKTIPGAIYIHYNEPERRELVIHESSFEEAMLAHQAFIQYFRAFIPNPPSWLLDGFAVYFSDMHFNPHRTLSLIEVFQADEENISTDVLSADILSDEFKITSWALVSFLLSGDRDYYRALAESFMLLSPDATASENTRTLIRRFSPMFDIDVIEEHFRNYLDTRKTFAVLMEEGHLAYSRGSFLDAELFFHDAILQRPNDFAPYYYLGLIAYREENYDRAEHYFNASRERGADGALINYALGINAIADGRSEDAAAHLHLAAGLDPGRWRTRAEELLRNIRQ